MSDRIRRRVAIFGTHPQQFNGYSKVVYELCKATVDLQPGAAADIELHVFGFQRFHSHPGHRIDLPPGVTVHDAFAQEEPKSSGFGVSQAREYVERVRPDMVVVFNDMMVLTTVVNELKTASNRADFKLVAYIDQVYLCQRRAFIDVVNQHCDAAIAFTPEWRDSILWQGLRLKTYVLDHGINPATYFPIPRKLARRFYGIGNDDFLVLNLNRNQPRKRWDTCMQAFAEVIARRPEAPIKMVVATQMHGAWDLLELLRRELRKRDVPDADAVAQERIVVPGHPQQLTDEETNALLNIADIGINTCDGEGFGLCNFEQAALGIPQIVPSLGGFIHVFEHERTALMVQPVTSIYIDTSRDGVGGEALLTKASDYADAILRLYDDEPLRASLGRAGREHIIAKFPWSRVARDFVGIIDAVVPPKHAVVEEVVAAHAAHAAHAADAADVATSVSGVRCQLPNTDAITPEAFDAVAVISQQRATLAQQRATLAHSPPTDRDSEIEDLKAKIAELSVALNAICAR